MKKDASALVRTAVIDFIDVETMKNANPVGAALGCVQPLRSSELSELNRVTEQLEDQKKKLFACEADVGGQIDCFANIIARRRDAILILQSEYPDLSIKYPFFDLETALKWRNQDGYPSLAIYSLTSNVCKFVGKQKIVSYNPMRTRCTVKMRSPKLPKAIKNYFADFIKKIRKMTKKVGFMSNKVTISSQFRGMIPQECRQAIVDAQEDFGENIFILSEAAWETKITNLDPIVIGYKHKHAWLISVFDLTSLETEIAKHALKYALWRDPK